ncbi:hypothetical protein D3272_18060 [Lichenibacterium ramalinae]|uniref:Peptidase S33 tripeptidyl aminopeptidase-like C-terminal domain-containing protein n=1 Tax=Lichenibacterium ramalinae TaxID=2316527 RepID=A0A4Q2RDK2_9HYPH|nr:hypothetical protein D3272_18060 [Lichenibacterium ramalinae]
MPVAIVAGDGDTTVPVATNARHIAGLLPGASLDILPGGVSHDTFLNPCFPAAMDDHAAICRDAAGVDRREVHRRTAARALAFFGSAWGGSR